MAKATTVFNPRVPVMGIPDVRYSQAPAEALNSLADTLFKGASLAERRAQEERLVLAKREAARAAQSGMTVDPQTGVAYPGVVQAEGTDAFSRAFNAEAQRIYAVRAETLARQKVQELAVSHKFDPVGMEKNMTAWSEGMKRGMPIEMHANFDSAMVTLGKTHILAAHTRIAKAAEEGAKFDREANKTLKLNDAQAFGQMMAQGGSGAVAAGDAALKTYFGHIMQTRSRVDGFTYTEGEANRDMVTFTSDFVEHSIMGLFDGSSDKEEKYKQFMAGDLQMDIPTIAKVTNKQSGKVEITPQFKKGNARNFMTLEAEKRIASYMGAQVTAAQQSRDRVRKEQEFQATQTIRTGLRTLATTQDGSARAQAFRTIQANPYATDQQIGRARQWMTDGITDDEYFRNVRSQVLTGNIVDIQQTDPTRLSIADRDRVNKMVEEFQSGNHWSKSIQFTNAVKTIRLDIADEAKEVAVTINARGTEASQLSNTAANRMELGLRREIQRRLDGGAILGHNPSGKAFERVKRRDQATGAEIDTERFDPQAWVRQTTEELKARVKPLQEQLKSARERMMQPGADPMAAYTDVKKLREKIKDSFALEIISEFE